jgi:hypothetical protein
MLGAQLTDWPDLQRFEHTRQAPPDRQHPRARSGGFGQRGNDVPDIVDFGRVVQAGQNTREQADRLLVTARPNAPEVARQIQKHALLRARLGARGALQALSTSISLRLTRDVVARHSGMFRGAIYCVACCHVPPQAGQTEEQEAHELRLAPHACFVVDALEVGARRVHGDAHCRRRLLD